MDPAAVASSSSLPLAATGNLPCSSPIAHAQPFTEDVFNEGDAILVGGKSCKVGYGPFDDGAYKVDFEDGEYKYVWPKDMTKEQQDIDIGSSSRCSPAALEIDPDVDIPEGCDTPPPPSPQQLLRFTTNDGFEPIQHDHFETGGLWQQQQAMHLQPLPLMFFPVAVPYGYNGGINHNDLNLGPEAAAALASDEEHDCEKKSLAEASEATTEEPHSPRQHTNLPEPPQPEDVQRLSTYDAFDNPTPWPADQTAYWNQIVPIHGSTWEANPMMNGMMVMMPMPIMLPAQALIPQPLHQNSEYPLAAYNANNAEQLDADFVKGGQDADCDEGAAALPTDQSTSANTFEPSGIIVPALGHSWVDQAPRPQTLRQERFDGGLHRIFWTVDGKKVKANDKVAVSPPLDIFAGNQILTIRIMMFPSPLVGKGTTSFRKADGRGNLQLKCESDTRGFECGFVKFRLSIGSGCASGPSWQTPRGPVEADFTKSANCGLPKEQQEWNFTEVIERISQTFEVCLEILP